MLRAKVMVSFASLLLTGSLVVAGCKSSNSKIKVFGVEAPKGYQKGLYSGVIGIAFRSPDGSSGLGSAAYVRNEKTGRFMLFTARHVVQSFGVPPGVISLFSGTTNILTVPSTTAYRVSFDLDEAGSSEARELARKNDFATIMIEDQSLLRTDITIEPIKLAFAPLDIGDKITFVGYGLTDTGDAGERRYGTNAVADIYGSDQLVRVNKVSFRGEHDVSVPCNSVICSDYRRSKDGAFKVDGATAGPGDSGSPLLNANGEMAGIVVSAGMEKDPVYGTPKNAAFVNFAVNIHSDRVGRFVQAEAAKIGVDFNPAGYDEQNRPKKPKGIDYRRAGKANTLGGSLPPSNVIVNDITGEVLFETIPTESAREAATSDAADSEATRVESDGSEDRTKSPVNTDKLRGR